MYLKGFLVILRFSLYACNFNRQFFRTCIGYFNQVNHGSYSSFPIYIVIIVIFTEFSHIVAMSVCLSVCLSVSDVAKHPLPVVEGRIANIGLQ